MRLAREEAWPQGPAHLADIEVAARIDGEAVRPDKRGRFGPGERVADPRQQLALVVDDADPRPEIGVEAVDRELADIADRAVRVGHVETAGPVQVVPLRLVLAVAVEDLDPMVLAVGDINPAIGVGADVMHEIELAL